MRRDKSNNIEVGTLGAVESLLVSSYILDNLSQAAKFQEI